MLSYWIKERHNPQLGVYYVACGQLTYRDARNGSNCMLRFRTKDEYTTKITALLASGQIVQL